MDSDRTIIAHPRHKYLRDDQYAAGYDHWEDDHALHITFKGATVGIFPSQNKLYTNDVFRECADKYQAALELAGLGTQGIVFERAGR